MPDNIFDRLREMQDGPPDYIDDAPWPDEPDRGRIQPRVPLTIRQASLRDAVRIPPREWLYGVQMLRKYLTVLVAPGGVGKTAWLVTTALSLACGRKLVGDHVHAPTKVLTCWLEDPEDEFDRRVAAAMMHHRIGNHEVEGRMFLVTGRDRQLRLAACSPLSRDVVVYPDKAEMVALIKAEGIGAILVDPFINSHELDENSNVHINAAARAWAEVGNETGAAIVLVHHTRKGSTAGDIEGARGAKALTDAARVGLTLTAMTEEEAGHYAITEGDRRRYVRLDDAKSNLSPPAARARWFHLASVNLGNETEEYPHGDNVQVIEEWTPPSLWGDHTPVRLNEVLDAIHEGPEPGKLYAADRRGGKGLAMWAGSVLMDMLGVTEEQAKAMVKTWVRNALLRVEEYQDRDTRQTRKGVTVDDSKRPA